MFDLRAAAAQLIENPLVPVPPVEGVVARARRYRATRLRRQAGVSVLLMGLVVTAVVRAGMGVDGGPDSLRLVGEPVPEETSGGVQLPEAPGTNLMTEDSPFLPSSGLNFDGDWNRLRSDSRRGCPVHTDPNLPTVKILAKSEALPSVDQTSPYEAVRAMVRVYNYLGGICGRAIEVVDDSLNSPYVPNDVVGVVGMPLDPELDALIANGVVDKKRIPVVGGDGLTEIQHQSPLVYPVGTTAAALTRTAIEHARSNGARNFTVVYDSSQAFAREAAESFSNYVAAIRGTVKAQIDVGESAAGFATGAERFRRTCDDNGCDFVFLALLPTTAQHWLQTRPAAARVETAALPTLLTGGFPESCFRASNRRCNGLAAWTGFLPWFETNRDLFAAADSGVIKGSAMTESAALAAQVLIEALLRTGPSVTPATLRATLEAGTFEAYPDVHLHWGAGVPRVGSPVAQRWRLDVDDVASWGTEVQQNSRNAASNNQDGAVQWLADVTTWADYVPSWAAGTARHAHDTAVSAQPLEDLHRWLESVGTWTENVERWSDGVRSRPPEKSVASLPLPPSLPEVPPLYYWPYGPPPPAEAERPEVLAPKKWWTTTGSGWRGDPAGG